MVASACRGRLPLGYTGSMVTWQLPRTVSDELMDDPALPAAEHHAALRALARINLVSGTAAQLARRVAAIAKQHQPRSGQQHQPLEIVDLACGGGDVTVAVARRLASLGVAARVTGVDMSERALAAARRAAHAAGADRPLGLEFVQRNLAEEGCPPCDVAISSLFLHHLDDPAAGKLLASAASAARIGLVISDLVRSRLGLALAVLGTRFLARSRVARIDGPLSVRAARTPEEYRTLYEQAGLPQPAIRPSWPARVVISWMHPPSSP